MLAVAALAVLLAGFRLPHTPGLRQSASGRTAEVGAIRFPWAGMDVNTAEREELEQVPGIGPKLAQAILDERTAHGDFYYPEDIMAVSGIGEKRMAAIYGAGE